MRLLLILVLAAPLTGLAQWKSFQIGVKGDTLNRVDLKGKKQGPWVSQMPELRGERGYEEEGVYRNDLKEGVWRKFSPEGDLLAMETFFLGMKHGKAVYFTNAGELLREENWKAIDPNNPYDTVDIRDVNDPNRIVRKEIVKVEPNSYKHGRWTYYNTQTGTVDKTEDWVMDKPKVKEEAVVAGGDDLAPLDVSDGAAKEGDSKDGKDGKDAKKAAAAKKPQAILDYEKKNSGKKKIKVRDGQTGN